MSIQRRPACRLPSIVALMGFEAVARTRSIAAAAREMHLTPSAVSKQLRELEQQLGCRLFSRTTRSVELTAEGIEYQGAIAPLLAGLEEATLQLRARAGGELMLELGVSHSLGNRWLIPRLASFYELHPDVRLNLTTISGVPDLAAAKLDCALAFCARAPGGYVAEHVMHLRLYPMASAKLAASLKRLDWREAIERHPLLDQATLPDAWPAFLLQIGIDPSTVRIGPRYQLLTMGLQAALSGLGVALLPLYVAQAELDAGRVVRLGDQHLYSPGRYQLLRRRSGARSAALAAFSHWVRDQGRRSEVAGSE
jgi:DNA-binding transcriptional LysR family regulator